MDLRINLLPPDVIEARRWERWYRYVFIGFASLLVLFLLLGAWLWLSTQAKAESLQGLQEQGAELGKQAAAFAVFEEQHAELQAREAVVTSALSGRVDVGRIGDEVSLVLPEEVWLESLTIGQDTGLVLVGYTPLTSSQSVSSGYKSVAATMVRLSSLTDLAGVWLTTAANADFGAWQVDEGEKTPDGTQPTVKFSVSGQVVKSAAATTTAPPPGTD